jgi:hypothetical protein
MAQVCSGTYDIIYSDPPWPQTKGGARKCRPNQGVCLDYHTLSIPDIARIHSEYFVQASDKHNVFLWTIDKFLRTAESMMTLEAVRWRICRLL